MSIPGDEMKETDKLLHMKHTSDMHFVCLKKKSLEERTQIYHLSQALGMLGNYYVTDNCINEIFMYTHYRKIAFYSQDFCAV